LLSELLRVALLLDILGLSVKPSGLPAQLNFDAVSDLMWCQKGGRDHGPSGFHRGRYRRRRAGLDRLFLNRRIHIEENRESAPDGQSDRRGYFCDESVAQMPSGKCELMSRSASTRELAASTARSSSPADAKNLSRNTFLAKLGPGLITGASDDDPSGIATYSQVGAQFGTGLLWTMLISYPLMAAIQEICARIGRVTGCGLAANLRKNYPRPLLYFALIVMSAANVFNLGADIGAMGASLALIVPINVNVLTVTFGFVSLLAVLFIPYSSYAKYLKWLTLSLFSYVGVIFLVHISWPSVPRATLIPHVALNKEFLMAIIAVLGTTISPYLFFWQASQEAEEVRDNRGEKALKRAPTQASAQLDRIRTDT
jgi:hypothetical protein